MDFANPERSFLECDSLYRNAYPVAELLANRGLPLWRRVPGTYDKAPFFLRMQSELIALDGSV